MPRKRTPEEPKAASESSIHTEVATPETVETPSQSQSSFVDRVGQSASPTADPFKIAGDFLAGVHLLESRRDRQIAIKFDEKPSQDTIDMVKAGGFHWDSANRVWARPVRKETAMTARIEAESLYQEVRNLVRQQKGIESSQEVPF